MKNDIAQNLNWLLIRASIPAKQTVMRAGELFGLTPMQLFTLGLIDDDGQTAMHTITTALGCDASNVTGLVEKLVASGFVIRSESARDRRIKLLALSEKGKRTREHIMGELGKTNLGLMYSLTDEEQATLSTLLTKVVQRCSVANKAKPTVS